jgi:hypothetical protein
MKNSIAKIMSLFSLLFISVMPIFTYGWTVRGLFTGAVIFVSFLYFFSKRWMEKRSQSAVKKFPSDST